MSIEVISNTPTEVTNEAKAASEAKEAVKDQSASEEIQDETTEESDSSETDVEQDENDEAQEESSDEESKEAPKKKNGFKKRIDKLNQRLSAKDQEIEHWKRQALSGQKPQEEQRHQEKNETTPKDGKPIAPRMADFETHEEYENARDAYQEKLSEWTYEQRSQKDHAKSQYQQVEESYNANVAEFKKETPDFQDALDSFIDEHGDIQFSQAIYESIKTSKHGPALLYELVKNPEELLRINSLNYGEAKEEIGAIKARLRKASEENKTTEVKKLTKAPPPIKPVGSGSSGSGRKSIYDPNISQSEYEQLRREHMRKKAQ